MPLCPCVETVHVTKGTVSTRGGIQEPTQDFRPAPARPLKSECGAQPSGSRPPAHRASAITVPRATANRRAATRRLSCNSGPNGKIVWGRSVNGGRRMVEASDLALLFNNEVANVLAALRAWAAASTRFSVRARVTFLARREGSEAAIAAEQGPAISPAAACTRTGRRSGAVPARGLGAVEETHILMEGCVSRWPVRLGGLVGWVGEYCWEHWQAVVCARL